MGMMVIFTRKELLQNSGLLNNGKWRPAFQPLYRGTTFIIELLIIIDLVMLIVLATCWLWYDSSIDEFHNKLNSYVMWFKE